MANYIVSYDLNGSTPSHATMDKHIAKKTSWSHGRVLETVWYVGTSETLKQVYDHFNEILSANDRLLAVEAKTARFRKLLITDASLVSSWATHS